VVDTLLKGTSGSGQHLFQVASSYGVHTVEDSPRDCQLFQASGLKSGHGTVSWTEVPESDMPHAPSWAPPGTPPVVLVLDSGVKRHPWLPARDKHPPFCVFAKPGPSSGLPLPDTAADTDNFHGYWGHATFLAGLIRLTAPDAQVMSLKLMTDEGTVDDRDVAAALDWAIDHVRGGREIDVILMAFGRPKESGEANPPLLKQQLHRLGRHGVRIVASAGNDGSNTQTIPACLAEDPDSPVVSVGAGFSAEDRAPYSNFGHWVREWRPGTLISLMPLTTEMDRHGNGYARWSGTSFSAALLAGELAQARVAERAAGTGP